MEVVFLVFRLGQFQRGSFDLPYGQPGRDHHLVALAGEDEKSHFDHHCELFHFHLVVQTDHQRGEIFLKIRKQNGRTDTELGDISHHQPINLLFETWILNGFLPERIGFRRRQQPLAIECSVSPPRPLDEDTGRIFLDRYFQIDAASSDKFPTKQSHRE